MQQPKGDPFFEQLKADVQEGIDEANRGEGIDAEIVWAHLREVIAELERVQKAEARRPEL
jgi:hypothetical protein